ncbi:MAG TPA: biotin--[acetyl-CoA-carboxylase] ligase [Actinomycetota bacterium]|nr:biotin--[acetyl-CoA-carboxylase] ligase [Actinomycetota bacterium]
MLSEHDLVRALEGIGLGAPVRFDEVTGSTQATALAMAAEGAPEWTLVAAGHQTEGRGRLEREWRDTPGRGLLFSIVLRPALAPEDGGLLSLLAGTALAHACREVADRRAACKWPNDVLVAGRKVGGILAESAVAGGRFGYVVLGVGVNLVAPPSDLPLAGAVEAGAADLLDAFLARFARGYQPAHPAFAGAVVAAYREVCATLGMRVRATTTDGDLVEGEAVDVDERGGLVVRTPGGLRAVRFGAVEHLE